MRNNFYINGRFFIEPSSNRVTDKTDGKISRLEARIMQLLGILAENPGKTITRDELVTLIWQDYGGGDEGLTQSISVLRKTLQDNNKQLVQTVPKKGYIFNGSVSYESAAVIIPENQKNKKKNMPGRKGKWMIIATTVAAVIGIYFIFFYDSAQTARQSTPSVSVPYPVDLAKEEQENEFNTIVTRGADSVLYKLVVIGDRPPRFFVNNKRLPEDNWEPYMSLINSLKKQLSNRAKN